MKLTNRVYPEINLDRMDRIYRMKCRIPCAESVNRNAYASVFILFIPFILSKKLFFLEFAILKNVRAI